MHADRTNREHDVVAQNCDAATFPEGFQKALGS